jgi:hypothetical protein
VEDTQHVDVHDPLECSRVDLEHGTVAGDAGVGHDNVDAAEVLDGLVGHGLHRDQVSHVGRHGQHPIVAEFVGQRG